jgi:FAD:protein FMN transferase
MAAVLRRRGLGRALLSAGGSSVLATGGAGSGWPVAIHSPVAGATIARVWLRDGALATSGAGEQFVVANGTRYGHVIDPRTGWPATGVISATVVTRNAAAADALSTALLVGGPSLAESYCRDHADTLALLLVSAGEPLCVYGQHAGVRLERPS